ncbi:MAG TPA: universal stress protein [Alphaproteobacteria bacterium]|nr:universal stress protein [Alphaproteobacteria bacterium]
MTIRSVLVPISGHPADKVVLENAFALATKFNAHIAVACMRPDPTEVFRYVDSWSAPSVLEGAVAAAEAHAQKVSQTSKAMFDRWREKHDLPIVARSSPATATSTSWAEYIGLAGDTLADIARFSDLVIMQTLDDKGPIEGDAMLEAVLFDAGRPVLLVPRKAVDLFGGNALIAWDGGHEALSAIVAAIPLIRRAKAVEILTVEPHTDTKAESLAVYLGSHGVTATVQDCVRGSKSIGEVVLREGKRSGASLLVMGGYHHGRTRELLFGGTTRRIIATTTTPVLLAR